MLRFGLFDTGARVSFLLCRLRRRTVALGVVLCAAAACDGNAAQRPRTSVPLPVFGDSDGGLNAETNASEGASEPGGTTSDEDAGTFATDRANGEACRIDTDCRSGHCRNDVCCSSGVCCQDVADCPAAGGIALTCDVPKACEGSRGPAVCIDNRCGVSDGSPDDRACDGRVVADECGSFAPVYCSGDPEQRPPRCPDTCRGDSDCDRNAHCDTACIPDLPKGAACDENSDCESGECNGGRCCVDGNCARDLAQPPEAVQRQCLDTLAGDACSRCGCTSCTEAMLACYDSGNEVRDSLCSILLECAFRESCFEACVPGQDCFRAECWCGTSCTTPSGSCTRSIEAAAGGAKSAAALAQSSADSSRPLYYAERYGVCLYANCRSECGL
jgi:hypothetical protein